MSLDKCQSILNMPPRKKDDEPLVKKGRKKKIDLSIPDEEVKNSVIFGTSDTIDTLKYNKQTNVSLGSINIIKYSAAPSKTIDDIKKQFESEQQSSNVLIQDTTQESNEENIVDLEEPKKKRTAKKLDEDLSSVGIWSKKGLSGTSKNVYKVLDTSDKREGVCCLWCCNTYNGPSVPRPIKYDKTTNIFNVVGQYCSWNCVAAHAIECDGKLDLVFKLKDFSEKDHLRKDPKYKIAELQPAPPKEALKMFGGHMSIEEFRNVAKGHLVVLSTDRVSYINKFIIEAIEG